MKLNNIVKLILCCMALVIYGCGGGGGTTTEIPPVVPPTTQATKISGTASAAPISGGTVHVYKIAVGVKSDLVGTGTTGGDGKYTVDIGTYTGPIVVEISGGNYTDEATGINRSIPADAPLHALIANASGNVTSAVTLLTELAYKTASSLTPSAINAANKNIGDMFKVSDIIASQPVAPTAAVLQTLSQTNLGQKDQYDYTLALVALSQMSKDLNKTVDATLEYIKSQSSGASLNSTSATIIQTAVRHYFVSGNATGVTDPASTALVTVGGKKAVLKLSTSGTLPSGLYIKGIAAEIVLPVGVSVKSDSTGSLANYLLATSSSSTISGMLNNNKVTINLGRGDIGINSTGEFATLECDIAYNAPSPLGSFTVSSYKITDIANGNTVDLTSSIAVTTSVDISE